VTLVIPDAAQRRSGIHLGLWKNKENQNGFRVPHPIELDAAPE
jgi:hypothetical protein